MKVLVACEYSGRVRDAFIARGHDAVSCDLLPSDAHGPHVQGDVLPLLSSPWDLIIAHPPCTYLTCAAEWAYKDPDYVRYPASGYHQRVKRGTLTGAERRAARLDAVEFVKAIAGADCPRIAIENPRYSALVKLWRAPDQTIHPHEFGDDASKATGLWLKGLPPLVPTQRVPPRMVCGCGCTFPAALGAHSCPNCYGEFRALSRWANQTDSGQNRESPAADRWKTRSTTWQGWADAMAAQWG